MLTKIARSLRFRGRRPAKDVAAKASGKQTATLTSAEIELWRQERQYWRARLREWFQKQYGCGLDPIQDDDATVPSHGLVAQIQTQRKCHPDVYFATGCRNVLEFLRELQAHGFTPDRYERILEFGVGLGRLIRHFVPLKARLFGCDVTPDALDFTRKVLGTRVALTQNGLAPPLPYDNGQFDFVYANSVFTHIQMADTTPWINELGRILRPGGALIVTVFEPNRYLVHLSQREFDEMASDPGFLEWGTSDVNERFMYMTPAKLQEVWSREFEILELRHHYRDQSHLVMRRR
jgi:SAM-dependent methyltransferase